MKIVINGEVAEIPGGESLQAGDGIRIKDKTISVTLPTKSVTQAEYEALTEEEKQAETVYLVEEPPWTPVPLSIQEYDTEDGWHVRKWSDGYIEQTMKKVYPGLNVTTPWGSGYNSGSNFGPFTYPEPFTELYVVNISGAGSGSVLAPVSWGDYYASRLTKTPIIGTYRPATDTNLTFYIYVFANGRWK